MSQITSISHMRFKSVTARSVPEGDLMPMILREEGEGIKVGDEIGYYEWFVQLSDDDIWYVLTAGVVKKIKDLVITFKPYKYKKEIIKKGYEWDTYYHWKKDEFDDEITFNVEKVNPADWGLLYRLNKGVIDYWKAPPCQPY
jgi:hypothetical protein